MVLGWPYLTLPSLVGLRSELEAEAPCRSPMRPTQRPGLWDQNRNRDQGPARDRVWREASCWRGEGACSGDVGWPLSLGNSSWALVGEGEHSRNAEAVGQPCQAGDGKPAELGILKPWPLSSNALRVPLLDVIQDLAANTRPNLAKSMSSRNFAIACAFPSLAFRQGQR